MTEMDGKPTGWRADYQNGKWSQTEVKKSLKAK